MQDGLMQDGQTGTDTTHRPHLSVRRAGLDDYSTIRSIHASAVRALSDRMIEATDVPRAIGVIYTVDYLSDLMAKATHVALVNGDIVGTGAWSPSDDRGLTARLSAFFVSPLFQGTGIGRELIRHLEADAGSHGYHRFTAIVPVTLVAFAEGVGYGIASYGTSRDIIPGTDVQVAFVRKPA
jgi:GNAT superfamily N-acetyltransferase